jgi:hypothetical protein
MNVYSISSTALPSIIAAAKRLGVRPGQLGRWFGAYLDSPASHAPSKLTAWNQPLLRPALEIDDGYAFARLTCNLTYWSRGATGRDWAGRWEEGVTEPEQETLGRIRLARLHLRKRLFALLTLTPAEVAPLCRRWHCMGDMSFRYYHSLRVSRVVCHDRREDGETLGAVFERLDRFDYLPWYVPRIRKEQWSPVADDEDSNSNSKPSPSPGSASVGNNNPAPKNSSSSSINDANKYDIYKDKDEPCTCDKAAIKAFFRRKTERARAVVEGGFQGLCLDCMYTSAYNDEDYWRNGRLGCSTVSAQEKEEGGKKGEPEGETGEEDDDEVEEDEAEEEAEEGDAGWDSGCSIRHGRLTWFYSYTGEPDDMQRFWQEVDAKASDR